MILMTMNKRILISYMIGAMICCSCQDTLASDFGKIKGVVRDSITRARLPGVKIEIHGTDMITVSDSMGRYELVEVEPGEHSVLYLKSGYDSLLMVETRVFSGLIFEQMCNLSPCDSRGSCSLKNVLSDRMMIDTLHWPPWGKYMGQITEESGRPISGASIDIVEDDTTLQSDSLGMFSIKLYGRSFTLRCTAKGYWPEVKHNVRILRYRDLVVNFRLSKRSE